MHIWDDKKGHLTFPYKRYAYTKNQYGTHVSLYGDKLKKVYSWDKEQSNLFESDISPELRTLVDLYTDSDDISIDHRIIIIDIEVEVTEGFPNISKAPNKITSIALYDSTTDKYFCYVLDEKLILDKDFGDDVYVNSCLDEYELLKEFYKKCGNAVVQIMAHPF